MDAPPFDRRANVSAVIGKYTNTNEKKKKNTSKIQIQTHGH